MYSEKARCTMFWVLNNETYFYFGLEVGESTICGASIFIYLLVLILFCYLESLFLLYLLFGILKASLCLKLTFENRISLSLSLSLSLTHMDIPNLFCSTFSGIVLTSMLLMPSAFKNHIVNMFYNHFVEPSPPDWYKLTAHELRLFKISIQDSCAPNCHL
jgi:hypothetical protein